MLNVTARQITIPAGLVNTHEKPISLNTQTTREQLDAVSHLCYSNTKPSNEEGLANMSNKDQSNTKNKRLGRGLSSLLGLEVPVQVSPRLEGPSSITDAPTPGSGSNGLTMIEVGGVRPSRFQPRRMFDETTLQQLADSIARAGVMQPIIVRPSTQPGVQFELVAGERRWRAAQKAGLTRVPAIVRELTDEESAEWGLVENVQRDELNAIERGFALKEMAERFGLPHAELAQRVGLERSSVANLIRLTELELEIRELIAAGKLSAGHGKALLMAPPGPLRLTLAKEAVARSWSVRRLEMAARDKEAPVATPPTPQEPSVRDAVVRDIERRVGQHLGTKVEVFSDRAGKRGRMVIEYYGLDHFEGILQRMGVPQE